MLIKREIMGGFMTAFCFLHIEVFQTSNDENGDFSK
jgi:hypothetical protein